MVETRRRSAVRGEPRRAWPAGRLSGRRSIQRHGRALSGGLGDAVHRGPYLCQALLEVCSSLALVPFHGRRVERPN